MQVLQSLNLFLAQRKCCFYGKLQGKYIEFELLPHICGLDLNSYFTSKLYDVIEHWSKLYNIQYTWDTQHCRIKLFESLLM